MPQDLPHPLPSAYMQWKRMVLYYIASALKQGDKCGGSLDEDGHLVTKVQGGWMAVLKFGMGDAEYDKLKEEDRERLTRMTTNLRKQNKTFLSTTSSAPLTPSSWRMTVALHQVHPTSPAISRWAFSTVS